MVGIQIGVIIFLLFILFVVCHDEYRKGKLGRKSASLNRFWHKDKQGRDRRQSMRIDAKIDVAYEVLSGKAAQKHSSTSRNISLGGINLALSEKLLPGTTIQLQLNMPQSPRPIFTKGKVVWVREISEKFTKEKEQRAFATGIQFTQIHPHAEAVLGSFINKRIKNVQEA